MAVKASFHVGALFALKSKAGKKYHQVGEFFQQKVAGLNSCTDLEARMSRNSASRRNSRLGITARSGTT
jgi:hypothetical protein